LSAIQSRVLSGSSSPDACGFTYATANDRLQSCQWQLVGRENRLRLGLHYRLTKIAVTENAKWRATVDEDGHYCFAVAL